MTRVRLALAAGLAVAAVAVILVLQEHPPIIRATNSVGTSQTIAATSAKEAAACQAGESLPSDTRAIRISIGDFTGPHVTIRVLSKGRLIAYGARGSGWDGQNVSVPLTRTSAAASPVSVCFKATQINEEVRLFGTKTGKAHAAVSAEGEPLSGRLRIEYLGEGRSSWLSMISTVTHRMSLGKAWRGGWVLYLLLMLALAAVTSRLIVRELDE